MAEQTWREQEDDGRWRGEEHPELPYQGARDPNWESKEENTGDDGPTDSEGEEA